MVKLESFVSRNTPQRIVLGMAEVKAKLKDRIIFHILDFLTSKIEVSMGYGTRKIEFEDEVLEIDWRHKLILNRVIYTPYLTIHYYEGWGYEINWWHYPDFFTLLGVGPIEVSLPEKVMTLPNKEVVFLSEGILILQELIRQMESNLSDLKKLHELAVGLQPKKDEVKNS